MKKPAECNHENVTTKDTVKFRFIGRDGPAADSLRTRVLDGRILIALDRYSFKFRFIEQAIVGWGHVNYGVIATGNHWICYAALCNSPTDAPTGPRHYVRTGCTPFITWSVGTCPHPTNGAV